MNHPPVRIVVETDEPPADVIEAVLRELRAFNRSASPAFYTLRDLPENAPRPLHVIARDDAGAVLGGLIGTTCLAWLDIDILAVRTGDRGRGIGRRLMAAAEAEAVARGCRHASVDTMDFQAPGFYERLGYDVVGTFADRDGHGHTKFFLTRRLSTPDDGVPPRSAKPKQEREPVSVFRAGPEHAEHATRAIRDVHGRPTVDDAAVTAFLADPSCVLVLAVAAGEVVGSVYGHVLRPPHRREPRFLLYELDVKPSWREQGIGSSLVAAFADIARAAGASDVWLLTNESNPGAMATYRRCGFVRRNPDDVMLRAALPRGPQPAG